MLDLFGAMSSKLASCRGAYHTSWPESRDCGFDSIPEGMLLFSIQVFRSQLF